jgi:hypothetical protein
MLVVTMLCSLALFATAAVATVAAPSRTLRYGSPESVGLDPEAFVELRQNASNYLVPRNCPHRRISESTAR